MHFHNPLISSNLQAFPRFLAVYLLLWPAMQARTIEASSEGERKGEEGAEAAAVVEAE